MAAARSTEHRPLIRSHQHDDLRAREELVVRFLPLARDLAGRYRYTDEPFDDLVQVASAGVTRATQGRAEIFDAGWAERGRHSDASLPDWREIVRLENTNVRANPATRLSPRCHGRVGSPTALAHSVVGAPILGHRGLMKRRRLLIDLVAVLWVGLWIALAVQVAIEVRGLRDLSSTVKKSGVAVREAGAALERLEQVPVVGSELADTAARVQEAGRSAVQSAESSRESVNNLSLLLAVAIALIPTVGLLSFYLHVRNTQRPIPYRRRQNGRSRQTVH